MRVFSFLVLVPWLALACGRQAKMPESVRRMYDMIDESMDKGDADQFCARIKLLGFAIEEEWMNFDIVKLESKLGPIIGAIDTLHGRCSPLPKADALRADWQDIKKRLAEI